MSKETQESSVPSVEKVEEIPTPDILPEAIDTVDLSLPDAYEAEILAAEVLDHISNYRRLEASRRAARHQNQHDKATNFERDAAFSRNAAALIQYEHPSTKVLYKELAEARAKQLRLNRKALADTKE